MVALVLCGAIAVALSSSGATAGDDKDCVGDIDGNGQVDLFDLVAVVTGWGTCPDKPEPCPADVDGDGTVGVHDLIAVLLNFGPCDGVGCGSHSDCDDEDDCTFDLCIHGLCLNLPIPGCG